MKKILLATTVFAGFAGVASAEVTLSGDARMGVIYSEQFDSMDFTSRARVAFALSGESDSGLSFGASFGADNAGGAAGGSAGSVYISGAFGKLSMGDVDSAIKAAVGQVSGVGLTGLGYQNEVAHGGLTVSATDPSGALYEYTTGGFTLYVSAMDGYTNVVVPVAAPSVYGIAAKYAAGNYTVAIGYEDKAGAEETSVGGSAVFGATTVKAVYADVNGAADYALSVDYTTGATTITGFVHDGDLVLNTAYGLGASYDLGGGAKVVGGIVSDTAGFMRADVGVSMAF
jgi:outer membrane protein OmpU